MKKRRTRISFITLVFLLSLRVHTWAWSGEVVGVTDGDTITVLNSKTLKDVKIRLYGIDTPEKGQAFGKRAKQFTSDMVFGKVVEVEVMTNQKAEPLLTLDMVVSLQRAKCRLKYVIYIPR